MSPRNRGRRLTKIRDENINTKEWWDVRHKNSEQNGGITAQFERFFEIGFVPFDKPINLLDVGCGQVLYVKDFEEKNKYQNINFHALDISSEVATKNKGLSSKVTTYTLDISKEEIPGIFDYIVSMHSFEHFDDPVIALNKCLKACTGRVIICVPYADAWGGDDSHVHKFTPEDPFTGYESYHILNSEEIFFVFKGLA